MLDLCLFSCRAFVPTACLAVLLDAHSALQLAISLASEEGDAKQLLERDVAVLKQVLSIITVSGSDSECKCFFCFFGKRGMPSLAPGLPNTILQGLFFRLTKYSSGAKQHYHQGITIRSGTEKYCVFQKSPDVTTGCHFGVSRQMSQG